MGARARGAQSRAESCGAGGARADEARARARREHVAAGGARASSGARGAHPHHLGAVLRVLLRAQLDAKGAQQRRQLGWRERSRAVRVVLGERGARLDELGLALLGRGHDGLELAVDRGAHLLNGCRVHARRPAAEEWRQ